MVLTSLVFFINPIIRYGSSQRIQPPPRNGPIKRPILNPTMKRQIILEHLKPQTLDPHTIVKTPQHANDLLERPAPHRYVIDLDEAVADADLARFLHDAEFVVGARPADEDGVVGLEGVFLGDDGGEDEAEWCLGLVAFEVDCVD